MAKTSAGLTGLFDEASDERHVIAVHVINRWGVILASTEPGAVGRVPLQILLALSRSEKEKWTVEAASGVVRSVSILDEEGRTAGSILFLQPKIEQVGEVEKYNGWRTSSCGNIC